MKNIVATLAVLATLTVPAFAADETTTTSTSTSTETGAPATTETKTKKSHKKGGHKHAAKKAAPAAAKSGS